MHHIGLNSMKYSMTCILGQSIDGRGEETDAYKACAKAKDTFMTVRDKEITVDVTMHGLYVEAKKRNQNALRELIVEMDDCLKG